MPYFSTQPTALLSLLALLAAPAYASQKGDGSFRVEYQYIKTGAFDSSIGDVDIGRTDGHALLFSVDYALTDRWTIQASLPYIRKRHQGALPHNANVDFVNYTPPDLSVVDDGKYHSDWQDLYAGVSYLAKEGQLTLEPFVGAGLPTNDYPFYGHAAVGRNVWHVPVGVAIGFRPNFSDWNLSGDVAYVFTEKSEGVDISHWLLHAEASYFLTRHFVPRIFVTVKHGSKGLDWPDDFAPQDYDSSKWYNHDRTIKHNFVNAGIGIDWLISDKNQASFSWFTMVNPDQVNKVELAYTLGFTRYFSAGKD